MSLAPREEQELSAIESRFRRSDPRLAAMFMVLSRHAVHGQDPTGEALSPWGRSMARTITMVLFAVLGCAIIVGTVLGVLLTSGAAVPGVPLAHA